MFNLPAPGWASNLHTIILDLEKLRTKQLYGEVPFYIFFQLKNIFQILETLGSARIEGNNTTLSEYVEKIIEGNSTKDEKRQELENLEKAIAHIEENTNEETRIDRAYLSHLHVIVTNNLTPPPNGEGSHYPGELRKHNVEIKKSHHKPPSVEILLEHFEKFVSEINATLLEQNQLLMLAVAHHRFEYIHPFDNGNGRMGRLLTYAFLIKLGFNVKACRIINPSSIFYSNRNKYNEMLARADSLKDEDALEWAEYFLSGLRDQIEKIDRLTEKSFTNEHILQPALEMALDRKHITDEEFVVLKLIIQSKNMAIKASALSKIGIEGSNKKSYIMRKLREKHMVMPIKENGREYTIKFTNNYLLRSIVAALQDNGFVADFLTKNTNQ